ncbi:MAG: family 20 glycosylhydrolase [bacterium]
MFSSFCSLHAICQEITSPDSLNLLPTPKETRLLEKPDFTFPDEIIIYTGKHPDEKIKSIAEVLTEELNERFSPLMGSGMPKLKTTDTNPESAHIVLDLPDGNAVTQRTIRENKIEFTPEMKDEGYALIVQPDSVIITGQNPAGIFYGAQTLLQLVIEKNNILSVPSVIILDFPTLKLRGITDDISRGQVPTMDYFKRTIRTLSQFKLNSYYPYIEDVFSFKVYPAIGEGRGALTADEVRELDTYAKKYYIQLIPIFETLGHQENILMKPEFISLAEFPGSFCLAPLRDETYTFFQNLFDEIVPAFSAPYFHFAADETWDVGIGRSKEFTDTMSIGQIHLQHYLRIYDLLKKYDRQIIMYGDIPLSHPEMIPEIPSDIIIFDWHYNAAEEFPSLDVFQQTGHRVIVSPAVSNWRRMFPDYLTAEKNILNFIQCGKERPNVIGAATSCWGDNGEENLRELNWYGYALTAEAAWAEAQAAPEDVRERFFHQFFGASTEEIRRIYKLLMESHQIFAPFISNLDAALLWRHPLFYAPNPFFGTKSKELKEKMGAVSADIEKFRSLSKRNADHLDYLQFAAERTSWLADLFIFVNDLNRVLKTPVSEQTARQRILKKIAALKQDLIAQEMDFSKLWLNISRKEGLELNLLKFNYMKKWLDDLYKILENNLSPDTLYLESSWIWADEKDVPKEIGKDCYFRKNINLQSLPETAQIQMIADSYGEMFINGEPLGYTLGRFSLSATYNKQKIRLWDIKKYLHPGENIIAVKAAGYDSPNAGINVYGEIRDKGGEVSKIISDGSWLVSCEYKTGWENQDFDESGWKTAAVLESPPDGAWGKLLKPYFQDGLSTYPGL